MNNVKQIIKNNNILFIFLMLIVVFSIIGTTFALAFSNFKEIGINTTTTNIDASITYDTNSNSAEIISNGNMLPISDSLVTGVNVTDTRVLKAKFMVTGSSDNPDNTIYDIALRNIDIDCALRTSDLKWRLYKNSSLLSEGTLSPTFDTMSGNRLVLTSTQQDLSSTTTDEYVFLLWISESCTGDITECDSSLDQSKYLNKTLKADIKLELSTKSKKQLVRVTGSEGSCEYVETEIPACNAITYNGTSQSLVSTSNNYSMINSSGINAGTYAVTLKLNNGYKWTDGSTDERIINCDIDKKDVTVTTLDQSVVYLNDITNNVSNISSEGLLSGHSIESVTLDSSIVEVGTGTVNINNVKIVDSNNNEVTYNYNIKKNNTGVLTVSCSNIAEEPTITDVEYNGLEQIGVTGGSYITLKGPQSGINIGGYTLTAVPEENYCWSDYTNAEKEYTWNITKMTPELTTSTEELSLSVSDTESTMFTYTYNGDGVVSCSVIDRNIASCSVDEATNIITVTPTLKGNTDVVVTVSEGVTYKAITKTVGINVSGISTEIPTSEEYCADVTYTGSSQTLTLTPGTGYTFKNNTGTNVGSYTVTATLLPNYTWSDREEGAKTFNCSIAKADCSCTISSASTDMKYPDSPSGTINYSCSGDGTISVSSSSSTISVGTIGSTSTSLTGLGVGTSTLTVGQTAGINYNDCSNASTEMTVNPTEYIISYDANGGTGAPTDQTKYYGTDLTLSSTVPTRSGYTFLGWSSSSTATSATYGAGGTYTSNETITLYAVWKHMMYLYKDGNIYAEVTGGWTGNVSNSNIGIAVNTNNFIIQGTGIHGSDTWAYLYTVNKIDLTNYKTLVFNSDWLVSMGSDLGTHPWPGVYSVPPISYSNIVNGSVRGQTYGANIGMYSFDISDLTGEYYIAFVLLLNGTTNYYATMKMTEVYLLG